MSRGAARLKHAGARHKLLEAAITVIRAKGYEAASVDELCAEAGVAKGSFFYHFESKEALAVATANYWSETTSAYWASAPYHIVKDPLDRLLAYVAFRKAAMAGTVREFSCLAGMMVQEVYETSAAIREACNASIAGHARTIEVDIADAIERYGVSDGITAKSLAIHIQVIVQGTIVLAKAGGDLAAAVDSLDHLQRYLTMVFQKNGRQVEPTTA